MSNSYYPPKIVRALIQAGTVKTFEEFVAVTEPLKGYDWSLIVSYICEIYEYADYMLDLQEAISHVDNYHRRLCSEIYLTDVAKKSFDQYFKARFVQEITHKGSIEAGINLDV